MIDHIQSEIDLIVGIGIILQVLLEMQVLYKGRDPDIVIPRIDPDIIIVIAIDQGSIGEHPAAENVIPSQHTGGIAIVDTECIAKSKLVFPKIAGKIDTVLIPQPIVGLGINIVKIKAVLVGVGIFG